MESDAVARRALLVAGGVNEDLCHRRYANDLAWWADALVERGFQCRIAHGDGVRRGPLIWCTGSTLTPARRSDFRAGVEWLNAATDLAILVVSNHGDNDPTNESFGICLWGRETISPTDLRSMLPASEQSAAIRVLVFGQCFAGLFRDLADSRTVVVTACGPSAPSYACLDPPGEEYDEFLYQFGTALFGAPPTAARPVPPIRPSLADAFHWAREHDRTARFNFTLPHGWPALDDPERLAETLHL